MLARTFFTLNGIFSKTAAKPVTDIPEHAFTCIIVRWRKRRWSAKAPSKLFNVRQETPRDPEEYAELMKRYSHYRTKLKAIRRYLGEQNLALLQAEKKESVEHDTSEVHLWQECLAINDKWNAQTAKIREAREEKERIELQGRILRRSVEIELEKEAILKEAKQRIVEESAKGFITMENLEEEIEKALDDTVEYNFAIDKQGQRYPGLESKPEPYYVNTKGAVAG